jgi:fibro-slime domain-containing protein
MFAQAPKPLFVVVMAYVGLALAVGCGGGDNQTSVFVDGGGSTDGSVVTDSAVATDSSAPSDSPSLFSDAQLDSHFVVDACSGASCFDGPQCGDGVIEAGETCDDGNTTPGDGCSGICQVESGWICPTPDKPCVEIWTCGNGLIDPGETCDDGNTQSGDGCSSSCQVEPGWVCPSVGAGDAGAGDAGPIGSIGPDGAVIDDSPPGGKCTQILCGNGIVQVGEECDDGNDVSGDGCSSTCQIEKGWVCPTPGAACVAAQCGDGVVAGSEQCDDGNTVSGDGCSSTCQVEPGWQCPTPDTKCIAKACGDGIIAGNEQCDDGNTTPGDGCSATCTLEPGFACVTRATPLPQSVCHKTVCGDGVKEGFEECDDGNRIPYDGCSPTCTIEPKCSGGTCTAVCGDGLKFPQEQCDDGNTVSGDGCSSTCTVEVGWTCNSVTLPPAASLAIPILYRDMLYKGTTVPGLGNPDFEAFITGVVTGLVNTHLGADSEPVWASNGPANNQALTGPTDFCWWYHENGCTGAGSANPYDRLVYLDLGGNPTTLTLTQQGAGQNVYQFDNQEFYPLDGLGWNAGPNPQTGTDCGGTTGHNFSFTSELHYPFTYVASAPVATFDFTGDDDVYGFINGQLVIDLGGVHGASNASVTLSAAEAATLGMVDGGWYSIDMFQAERHTCASTYLLTLGGFTHTVSQCMTVCGDGIVAGNEQCDNGVNNGSYGTCNANCTLAPYCGDDIVQTPPEQCDNGSNLATYGGTTEECGPGCKWAPYCGDGVKNGPEGCDQGASNVSPATAYGMNVCTTACTVAPYCGDGVPQASFGEQCDNGVNNGSYGTSNPNCTLAPYCGDGIVQNPPEHCDNGSKNESPSVAYGMGICTTACTVAPYCGDGIVEAQFGEQCDGTPGCNSMCQLTGSM